MDFHLKHGPGEEFTAF